MYSRWAIQLTKQLSTSSLPRRPAGVTRDKQGRLRLLLTSALSEWVVDEWQASPHELWLTSDCVAVNRKAIPTPAIRVRHSSFWAVAGDIWYWISGTRSKVQPQHCLLTHFKILTIQLRRAEFFHPDSDRVNYNSQTAFWQEISNHRP